MQEKMFSASLVQIQIYVGCAITSKHSVSKSSIYNWSPYCLDASTTASYCPLSPRFVVFPTILCEMIGLFNWELYAHRNEYTFPTKTLFWITKMAELNISNNLTTRI